MVFGFIICCFQLLHMFLGCVFSDCFGHLDPQHTTFSVSKTNSSRKSPLLQQIGTTMISSYFGASVCHNLSSCSVTYENKQRWAFATCFVFKYTKNDAQLSRPYFLFSLLFRPCSARVSVKVPWLVLVLQRRLASNI